MIRVVIGAVVLALALATPLALGDTDTYYEVGDACKRDGSNAAIRVDWHAGRGKGIANQNDSVESFVHCPIRYRGPSTVTTFIPGDTFIEFHDAISFRTISCTAVVTRGNANVVLGATRFSCSTFGGCAGDVNPGFTGYSRLVVEGLDLVGDVASYVMQCKVWGTTLGGTSRSGILGYFTTVSF